MRRFLAMLALVVPVAACASILGFDDVSLGAPDAGADGPGGSGDGTGDTPPGFQATTCDASVSCGPCGDGGCPQTPILGDHYNVTALAVDNDWLYITSFNDVVRVDKTTNVSTSLVVDSADNGGAGGDISAIALDGPNVYWAARYTDAFWCPNTGCPGNGEPIQVSPDGEQPLSIAVTGGLVLWVEYQGAVLVAADKLDGGGVHQISSTQLRSPFLLADTTAAWVPDILSGRVLRIDLDGGATTTIAQAVKTPLGIALVNGTIYYGDSAGGLGAVSATGGAVQPFGAPTKTAVAIASDGTYLYWADQGSVDASNQRVPDGCIWRCALASCTTSLPTALACGLYAPSAIAVDDHWVFWSTRGPGGADEVGQSQVTKVPKP